MFIGCIWWVFCMLSFKKKYVWAQMKDTLYIYLPIFFYSAPEESSSGIFKFHRLSIRLSALYNRFLAINKKTRKGI